MTGGFGANHHVRQSCVFLDVPVMQQPEAYWGMLDDKKLSADGTINDETAWQIRDRLCWRVGRLVRPDPLRAATRLSAILHNNNRAVDSRPMAD